MRNRRWALVVLAAHLLSPSLQAQWTSGGGDAGGRDMGGGAMPGGPGGPGGMHGRPPGHRMELPTAEELEGPLTPLEVRDEDLDRGLGQARANLGDASREGFRAAVLEVIAVDRRDDDVRQAHLRHGVREADGLGRIVRLGRPMGDRAVGAIPGTHVAQDHEGCGLVLPAFPDVGAARFLAHRVETQLPHQTLDAEVAVAAGSLHLEPQGLPGERSDDRDRTVAGCRGGTAELNER